MKHFSYISFFIVAWTVLVSCTSYKASLISPSEGLKVVDLCINQAKDLFEVPVLKDIDRAYVYKFENGYDISFSSGAVGTFGKRSSAYRQVFSCGVFEEKIVFLGAPLKDALIDDIDLYPYENYTDDVIEVLFKYENGSFEYCCQQIYDEKNLERNNTDFHWARDKVG